MERNEQQYAKDLYDGLIERFAPVADQTQISITGGGVQWRCSAQRGSRSCWVGCFEASGPEFLAFFEDDTKKVATGRTSSKDETVDAIWHWLDGDALAAMYECFRFVDSEKRQLMSIRESALKAFPALGNAAQSELTVTPSGVSHLWFRTPTRAAHVYFDTRHDTPLAVFYWDECELFRFEAKNAVEMAKVLSRWLDDDAAPSALRKEFPWIEIGPLADFYENGHPVEGEFIASWDQTEGVYKGLRFPPPALVMPFIAEMRRAGYDRKVRAGQSMWSLIVSRSRRARLRPEQPLVSFQFRENSMEVFARTQGEERIFEIPIAMSDTVERVLQSLAERPVD
ncbi:MAG TPA: hypothetical protein VHZ25_06705 [Acidobacteriaceae bacterium]|jgi:hypothetical protein|nr:hypothetical protein [Acidobacteriaceae bacterium]